MSTTPEPANKQPFDEWAKVELFGHNIIVGRVSETTLAGGAFLRVDVPAFGPSPAFTRFYNPSAIYGISPISEDLARQMLSGYRNEPVSRFDLPQIADKCEPGDRSHDDDAMDDDDDQPAEPGHPDDTHF